MGRRSILVFTLLLSGCGSAPAAMPLAAQAPVAAGANLFKGLHDFREIRARGARGWQGFQASNAQGKRVQVLLAKTEPWSLYVSVEERIEDAARLAQLKQALEAILDDERVGESLAAVIEDILQVL